MQRTVFRNRWLPYLLVFPQMAVTVLFFFWPALKSLQLSLYRVSPFGDSMTFVGLANFAKLLGDAEYYRSVLNSFVFSVDGKMLISAAYDTTLLFWDLSRDRQALRLDPRPRSSQEPETLWSSLADSDASRAYQAITALRETPAQTVPFLQRHLHPARTPDSRQIARLMNDLDSPDFEVCQKATAELKRLGDLAEPALRGKLLHPLSLEARQRIEQLLEQVTVAGPEGLRVLRAIEVLEQIGTPEARQLLKTLAEGAPESLLTRGAAASWRRLRKQPAH